MASDTPEPDTKRVKIESSGPGSSNDHIRFHLVNRDGSEKHGFFRPEMTHQYVFVSIHPITTRFLPSKHPPLAHTSSQQPRHHHQHDRLFEEEEIKGHDISIDIYFTPAFQTLLSISTFSPPEPGATDLGVLQQAFTADPLNTPTFFETRPHFETALSNEQPLRISELGSPIPLPGSDSDAKQQQKPGAISILHSNLATASPLIRALHARLQPLLLFFVDAASPIDASDPAWDLLLAVEQGQDDQCKILGFATLYNFWVFPDRKRVRLSQVLVLPPYQGRGVGTLLVQAAYHVADAKQAIDITLEDPTDDMQRIRDKIDLERCMAAQWPREEAEKVLQTVLKGKGKEVKKEDENGRNEQPSPLSAPSPLLTRLQKEIRMSRQQSVRMWEGLLYAVAVPLGLEALASVEGLVRASIEAQVSGAKKGSEGKKLTDTESGFVMVKVKQQGSAAALAAPGVVPVEGVSAEQQRQAIGDAVAGRVDELRRLVGLKTSTDDDDDFEEQEEENDA